MASRKQAFESLSITSKKRSLNYCCVRGYHRITVKNEEFGVPFILLLILHSIVPRARLHSKYTDKAKTIIPHRIYFGY